MNASSSVDIARAGEAINEGYFVIADNGPRWEWLEKEGQFTIDSTTDTYAISSIATALGIPSVAEIYHITNDTHSIGPLKNMTWGGLEEFAESTQDDDARGVAASYAVYGSKVRFYPWPNDTQTMGIIVMQGVSEMTSDTDTPLIPLAWRFRLLVPYAASILLQQRGGGEAIALAAQLENVYEKGMDEFEVRYASARFPQVSLESESWNDDLPGSDQSGYYDYSTEL